MPQSFCVCVCDRQRHLYRIAFVCTKCFHAEASDFTEELKMVAYIFPPLIKGKPETPATNVIEAAQVSTE